MLCAAAAGAYIFISYDVQTVTDVIGKMLLAFKPCLLHFSEILHWQSTV